MRSSEEHEDGHPPGQRDRLGVGGPEGSEDDDLVARVAQHGEGVRNGLLATVRHQHLLRRHREMGIAQGLGGQGLAEGRDPARRGVAVVGRVTAGLHGGLDDVRRRREVGLAGAEADHMLTCGLQRLRLGVHSQGGGRGDRGGSA